MKKLMKKKVNVFGKKLPVFMIVLLGIAVVSAALVPYLSNTVFGIVDVDSPITQEISFTGADNSWETDDTIEFNVHGGESVHFFVRDTNLADVPITGLAENRVTNTGITCADFESVSITTTTTIPNEVTTVSPGELISAGLCVDDGDDDVLFMWGPLAPTSNQNTWSVGQVDTSEITVTFKTNAFGIYTFTSEVLVPETTP